MGIPRFFSREQESNIVRTRGASEAALPLGGYQGLVADELLGFSWTSRMGSPAPLHFEVASREPIAWRYWNAPHVSGFRQTQPEQPRSLVLAQGNTVHDIRGDAIPGG